MKTYQVKSQFTLPQGGLFRSNTTVEAKSRRDAWNKEISRITVVSAGEAEYIAITIAPAPPPRKVGA